MSEPGDRPARPRPDDARAAGPRAHGTGSVLARAGASEPEPLLSLTDEQLVGLEGTDARQPSALPWLDARPDRVEEAAEVAVRGLLAAGRLEPFRDPGTGAEGLRPDPELAEVLVLRRTAAVFTTLERTVRTVDGAATRRVHWYVDPDGVLEEEVTGSGIHRFTPLRPAQAAGRLAAVIDPDGTAGDSPVHDSPTESAPQRRVVLRASELTETSAMARRLAAARGIAVLTSVRSSDAGVRQVSLYPTPEEVLLMEALDPTAPDPRLQVTVLDADAVRALAVEVVSSR